MVHSHQKVTSRVSLRKVCLCLQKLQQKPKRTEVRHTWKDNFCRTIARVHVTLEQQKYTYMNPDKKNNNFIVSTV